jgi:DNA-binding transcriptional MerR regulator
MPSIERHATVKDAADFLHVSTEAIRKYEARGVLPPAMRNPINGYRVWERRELLEACERLLPRRPEAVGA